MNTPQLNEGQKKAADGFFQFLFNDKKELIISGPGGVGKTFLMGHLIDEVMPCYHDNCKLLGIDPLYDQVMMTATTNKAAEVLGLATRRPTQTVHSFLNLRVVDDYSTGESKLIKTNRWTVHQKHILFVDESSMIDFKLRHFLREGTSQTKIVYVGDHCQLAPVAETLSPIYRDDLPFFELTEPMRNADQPALMAICNQLRETVKTGVFRPIRIVPGVIDLLDDAAMKQELQAHFSSLNTDDRILAYTNNRVIEYNDYVRAMRGLPKAFTAGERVINNSAITFGRNNSLLATEDEVLIQAAGQPTKIAIDTGIELAVQHCDLVGRFGSFTGIPVPVDRDHFQKLIKHYGKTKNWVMYYKLKNNYPDLRPRDAATVHKSQGSTYNTVFIDLGDLSTCRDPSMAARLLYVAFTRAKERVVLYGELASKFGGTIK